MLSFKPSLTIRTLAPYLGSDNPQLREFAEIWFQQHDNAGYDSPLLPVNYNDYAKYVAAENDGVPAAFAEFIFTRAPERALLVYLQISRRDDLIERLQEMNKNVLTRLQQENNGRGPIPPPKEEEPEDRIRRIERQQFQFDRREILLAEHFVGNAIWLKNNKFDEQFQKALPDAKEELAMLSEHSQWWVRLYVAEIMRRHRELRIAGVLEKLSSDSNALVSKAANNSIGRQ
mgnify:CR=1 FL=1